MSNNWDDFDDRQAKRKGPEKPEHLKTDDNEDSDHGDGQDCDWGIGVHGMQAGESGDPDAGQSNEANFIKIYEKFLHDKDTVKSLKTKNHGMYQGNSQKTLREWFEREEQECEIETEQSQESGYICTVNLPIGEHDFAVTSECRKKKQTAIDEVCTLACIMLDECQMLFSWDSNSAIESESDRKRRFDEANKEDDIALDNTRGKKVCCRYPEDSSDKTKGISSGPSKKGVHTYESLMAKWNELNKCIISSKAELVKLDLSVRNSKEEAVKDGEESDSEIDPLDAFMSELETKTELSRDDKIEKSRLKSQIAGYEREQAELSRLIQLAKPSFDLNKAIKRPNS